jgi:hypothetical protein
MEQNPGATPRGKGLTDCLAVRVPSDVGERFRAAAASQQRRPSDLLRIVLDRFLSAEGANDGKGRQAA